MKLNDLKIKSNRPARLILAGLLCCSLACQATSSADAPATTAKPKAAERAGAPAASSAKFAGAATNAADFEGVYRLNDRRPGREGYENSLTVKPGAGGRIHLDFEGAFFFEANGAETFHDTAAEGDLTLKGNVATGRLVEVGSGNDCPVELDFADGRATLRSSGCDLRVTPDGVYRRDATQPAPADGHGDIPEERDNTKQPRKDDQPFIQYDERNAAVGVVNLMERDGEREGCEKEIRIFTGKVVNTDEPSSEFTLAGPRGRRQNFSLNVTPEDDLDPRALRSLIKTGNTLEVRYLDCGNAPIATPVAIYLK